LSDIACPNGISIESAVFPQYALVSYKWTDRATDRSEHGHRPVRFGRLRYIMCDTAGLKTIETVFDTLCVLLFIRSDVILTNFNGAFTYTHCDGDGMGWAGNLMCERLH